MTEVTITGIPNYKFVVPQKGKIKVRGWRQGAKASNDECSICRDDIVIGKQYIRTDDGSPYCLGCARFEVTTPPTEEPMNIEVGKTYLIKHQRKGVFAGKIIGIDDTWTTAIVTGGSAKAMLDYNVAEKGDTISVRAEWITGAVEQLTPPTEERE
jgi:hypothetical protein